MDTRSTTEQILSQLAEYWNLHKSPVFLEYLRDTFGTAPLELPQFDCIYIVQAKEGDPVQGWIGGLITQWWMVDNQGICPISTPDLPRQPDAPENLRSGFYPRPIVKFFFLNEQITTGESYGPIYTCRKTARLKIGQCGLVEFVEGRILWTSSSLGLK